MKINYAKVLKKIAAKDCYDRRRNKKEFMKAIKLWFNRFEKISKR